MTDHAGPAGLASPDWLLAKFDVNRDLYHFAAVSRDTYHRSPFLDHRIQPMPTQTRSVSSEQLAAELPQNPGNPFGWIFHTGFCCSTLLASCLDHPGTTLVLREPAVLSRLAQLGRENIGGEHPTYPRLSRRVISLCERSYSGERGVIKPSNFANFLLPELMQAQPGSAARSAVFMSSGLYSLLVSMLKKRSEAETALPGFLRALLQDSDYLDQLDIAGIEELDLLQQSVVFWHCQRYFLQDCLQDLPKERKLILSMERFLAEPGKVLSEVSAFLQLGLTDAVLKQTVAEGAFRRHSKNKSADYDAGLHQQEQQATTARFQAEIAAALDWAQPLLEKLPVRAFDAFEQNTIPQSR